MPCAEQLAGLGIEQQLECHGFAAGIVACMVQGMDVDFAKGALQAAQRLLGRSGGGGGTVERANDRRALRTPITDGPS